jgi:UV DNA damage endonuclease
VVETAGGAASTGGGARDGSMIRIGYACVNTQLPPPNRTCRLSHATPERIVELARENLAALETILHWNAEHGITLFRIASETIPFGSHEVNALRWWEILQPELKRTGKFIRQYAIRVSMHPGQFTVLNSLRDDVVEKSLAELEYHTRFLDSLGVGSDHKIIVHLGGVFGDKNKSLQRFADNFRRLSLSAQKRLLLENDEKCYNIAEVIALAQQLKIPAVFDVFHHEWNPSYGKRPLREVIELAISTWRIKDGRPKLHYSNQWKGKLPGSHSQSVDIRAFKKFYDMIADLEIDIMLEVKDKERSVLNVYRAIPQLKHNHVHGKKINKKLPTD